MTLGEKIYELRTQHNLSQGDLANELNVSRQSISKWENGNSTPDLEKIVKLAEIFNVSLDELIKNEEKDIPVVNTSEQNTIPQTKTREKKIGKGLLIAGVISIFAFLLLGLGITGFIFALPLFACSIIYYKAKNNHLLYCLWAIIPMADLFIRYATGISWPSIRLTLMWEESWNYGRLAIAWGQFIVIAFLIIFSVVKRSKNVVEINKRFKKNFIASILGFTLIEGAIAITSYIITQKVITDKSLEVHQLASVINIVAQIFDWLAIYLFADAVSKLLIIVKRKFFNRSH